MDTETTGLDPAAGAALLEVAWVCLSDEYGQWQIEDASSDYVRYDGRIPAEAKAVHHIKEADVGPGSSALERDAILHGVLAAEEPGAMVYAFHNRAFDLKFLPELSLPVICTFRCAKHLWPCAPGYSNQVLRYAMEAEPPEEMLAGLAPHRALYDAAVTAAVLSKMLDAVGVDELVRLSDEPVLLRTVSFGKHKGDDWRDVPRSYLSWLLDKSDMVKEDVDLRHTVRHHLGLART